MSLTITIADNISYVIRRLARKEWQVEVGNTVQSFARPSQIVEDVSRMEGEACDYDFTEGRFPRMRRLAKLAVDIREMEIE